ncbi:2'-5' RNA ligase family protein [Frankia sp. AgB32]|uniref:2'-5' RNA ligase family protein n=1 Tax=Frankia sp. AgB32 TaxID=631119 RepID=UPI00200E0547|nr:2'-5' RNA ligase family protein [Frankia sp. AgB32]MCK9895022.1 2'-5' RNA ligase family protein [Frankia sp. AgB32]
MADQFWQLDRLHNHWGRPGERRSWQWYLTFEDCPDLHALVARCQAAVAFPFYDLVPVDGLHLTLGRIARSSEISADQVSAVAAAAARACAAQGPFDITVGALGGTGGALGFAVEPTEPLCQLRETLRLATRAALPGLPPMTRHFEPHLSLAYCNTDDVPTARAHAAVETLRALAPVTASITGVALVHLERRERAYAWRPVARISLPA